MSGISDLRPLYPSHAAEAGHSRLSEEHARPGLSFVVCTHNGADRLGQTLRHLAAQTGISSDAWEVVLVDNASTDNTASRAREIWRDLGTPAALRVIAEPRLGVVNARLAGILAARRAIVSFVDDDNWVCQTWAETVIRLMATHSGIGAIACRSEAAFDPDQVVPEWFPRLQHGYAIGRQGAETGWVKAPLPRYPTAGLSFRRDAVVSLLQRGFSTILSGRFGKDLVSGEDAELCYALTMAGHRFWYEDGLWFKHHMPSARLTEEYAKRLYRGLGVASGIEDLYHEYESNRRHFGFRGRLKRIGIVRYANLLRRLLHCRARILLSAPASPARSEARIVESFFVGRLASMRHHRKNSNEIFAHIARWAPARPDAPLGPIPKSATDLSAAPGRES